KYRKNAKVAEVRPRPARTDEEKRSGWWAHQIERIQFEVLASSLSHRTKKLGNIQVSRFTPKPQKIMSNRLEGKVLEAQGGGPTAVINQSIVGVTLEARKFAQVKAVYGAINGVRGIVNEDFIDLTRETTHNLEQVADTPSSALLSTRDKPD